MARSPGHRIRQRASGESDTTSIEIRLGELLAALPLPWSAYVRLLSVKNTSAREFYGTEALRGEWSVRQLDRQINSQFYERTALSKNKAAMLTEGQKPRHEDRVEIKDPFVLEFLDLKDEYSESDLEEALIRHLETFLLELGGDFCFMGRQRRLRIGDKWFRVDLLFFHRRLRCLVVIDLKIGGGAPTPMPGRCTSTSTMRESIGSEKGRTRPLDWPSAHKRMRRWRGMPSKACRTT